MPLLPDISMPCCDVRTVAAAHIKAMELTEAQNNRHIIVTNVDSMTFKEIALILQAEFQNYNVPTTVGPNCMVKIFSIFDKSIKLIVPMLGKKSKFNNSRLINVLKLEKTPINKTIIDMANSLIERNVIKRK